MLVTEGERRRVAPVRQRWLVQCTQLNELTQLASTSARSRSTHLVQSVITRAAMAKRHQVSAHSIVPIMAVACHRQNEKSRWPSGEFYGDYARILHLLCAMFHGPHSIIVENIYVAATLVRALRICGDNTKPNTGLEIVTEANPKTTTASQAFNRMG